MVKPDSHHATTYEWLVDPIGQNCALNDVQRSILTSIADGMYDFVLIETPCSSLCVAIDPPIRSLQEPHGISNMRDQWGEYLDRANVLIDFTARVIRTCHAAGQDRLDRREPGRKASRPCGMGSQGRPRLALGHARDRRHMQRHRHSMCDLPTMRLRIAIPEVHHPIWLAVHSTRPRFVHEPACLHMSNTCRTGDWRTCSGICSLPAATMPQAIADVIEMAVADAA